MDAGWSLTRRLRRRGGIGAALVTASLAVLFGSMATGGPAIADTSGTNGKISFTQTPDGDSPTAFIVDPDGTALQQVGPGNTECTAWAPDGSKILCNVWGSPAGVQPGVADPDGSHFHLLSSDLPFDLFCTHWSPNGTRLLCHSEGFTDPANAGLYTVSSSDAGNPQRVTAQPKGSGDVANGFSPDGSHILFSRFRSEEAPGALFSVRSTGEAMVRLSPRGLGVIDFFARHLGASWSPDGSHVAFAGEERATGTDALFVENADGTGLHRIGPSSMSALSAQWSPDGRYIAFTDGCTCEVWIIRPDGTGRGMPVPPSSGSFARLPVWSPDSVKLLFVRNVNGARALWTVSARGGGLTKVADLELPLEYSWGTASLG